MFKVLIGLSICQASVLAFVPFIDGGNGIPKLYDCYFNEQVAKQAATAVSKAIAAGKFRIEVNFPPVPNVDEAKFGTPLNQKFGTSIIARDLGIPGGYKPGSDVSRQLIAFSNFYWAKRIGAAASGSPLGGKPVCVLTSEQLTFDQIKSRGSVSRVGAISSQKVRAEGRNGEVVVCINPGGEETWDRTAAAHGSPRAPFIMLNNAYSTSYGLGNTRDFEEAYFLKRISKGYVFRAFPGPWQAYLEKPDGTTELLESYKTKPQLKDVATLVREESFKVRTECRVLAFLMCC
jgi:hypothetical protein